jgi:hypothetical protein
MSTSKAHTVESALTLFFGNWQIWTC